MGNLVKETPYSEITATLELFDSLGITQDHLTQLRADKEYATRVAKFMLRGGVKSPIDLRQVRAIMGERYFGPEEWLAFYGARLPKRIPAFPWNEDVLNAPCPFFVGKRIAETHFAFLGLPKLHAAPLTLRKWQEEWHQSKPGIFLFTREPWHRSDHELFDTTVTCDFRWYLILKEVVPGSQNMSLGAQVTNCLPPEYELPSAIAEVTKNVLSHQRTGIFPNSNSKARTADTTSTSYLVTVGPFRSHGLYISYQGNGPDGTAGIAASRKVPPGKFLRRPRLNSHTK